MWHVLCIFSSHFFTDFFTNITSHSDELFKNPELSTYARKYSNYCLYVRWSLGLVNTIIAVFMAEDPGVRTKKTSRPHSYCGKIKFSVNIYLKYLLGHSNWDKPRAK